MKTILLILLLSISVAAQSAKEGKSITDWTPVVTGTIEHSPAKFYWARSTIRRDEDIIKVWLRVDFPAGADLTDSTNNLVRGIASIREFVIMDCATKSGAGDTEIVYFTNGKVKSRENFASKNRGQMDANAPDFGGMFAAYFCEIPSPPTTTAPVLKKKPK